MNRDLAGIVAALAAIRTRYDGSGAAARKRLLRAAARCEVDEARVLLEYHDLLLFLVAFPDDATALKLAVTELRRVGAAAKALVRRARRRDLALLENSGIAHTLSTVQLSLSGSTWLATRFERDTRIAWDAGSAGDGVDAMLSMVVEPVEFDGSADVSVSTQAWFSQARGPRVRGKSDARWLLDHFARLGLRPPVSDKLFELFELRIDWRLRDPVSSRTFGRIGRSRTHFQRSPLERHADGPAILAQPPAPSRPEPRAAARDLIDRARAVLAVRQRETDPVSCAQPADVTVFGLGRGIEIVLFGLAPDYRLPLDTYYGFMLAKNRVPMAYGGGWVFFDRCEIGLNVFDAFRGGESAHAFATILRVYRWHFRVGRFTVDPYQIGADNPEAIRSGAVWFYYRLGFRPRDPDMRALAAREWTLLQAGRGHRSTPYTLRRLATSPLELRIATRDEATEFDPAPLSLAATRWIGSRFGGDRDAARRASIARVCRALGTRGLATWPEHERRAFENLCVLVAPIADIGAWTRAEKQALERLMRAKGGLRERRFALLLQRHARLRDAWARLAAS